MTTIKLSEAKDRLSEIVKETAETTEPVMIAVHGRNQAVLLSVDEYDSLKETIEILKDGTLTKRVLKAIQEIQKEDVVPFEDIQKKDVA